MAKAKKNPYRIPRDRHMVEIRWADFVSHGVIYEISPTGIKVFCTKKFLVGTTTKVSFVDLSLTGTLPALVIKTAVFPSLNNILKLQPYFWRMTLDFTPDSVEEQWFITKIDEEIP